MGDHLELIGVAALVTIGAVATIGAANVSSTVVVESTATGQNHEGLVRWVGGKQLKPLAVFAVILVAGVIGVGHFGGVI